jgi:CO/xanthine dehydrogenase Mo-binding subunit
MAERNREAARHRQRFRPSCLKAGLDDNGRLIAWRNRIVGQSIVANTPFQGEVKSGIDGTSVEGAAMIPYAIPNLRVELATTEVGVPASGGAPWDRRTPPTRSRPFWTRWPKLPAGIRSRCGSNS